MTTPTLTITISRTSLPGSLSPLVLSGSVDSNALGIVNYQPPARLSRITYAPDPVDIDGSEDIAVAWQDSLLNFDWMPDQASTWTVVQTSYADIVAALGQFSYTVTTQVSSAPAEVWTAKRGSITPPGLDFVNMAYRRPVYAVTIPVRPIPGS